MRDLRFNLRQEAINKFCNDKILTKYIKKWNKRITDRNLTAHYRWRGRSYDRLRDIDRAFFYFLRRNQRKALEYKGSWPIRTGNRVLDDDHANWIGEVRGMFEYWQNRITEHLHIDEYIPLEAQCVGKDKDSVHCLDLPALRQRYHNILAKHIDYTIPYSESLENSLG